MKEFTTIYDLFLLGLEKYKSRDFLQYEDEKPLTWEQVHHRVLVYADELEKKGIKSNQVVAVALERSINGFISFLAINSLGAIYCPIDTSLSEQAIAATITECKIDAFVTQASVIKVIPNQDRYIILLTDQIVLGTDFIPKEKSQSTLGIDQPTYRISSSGSTGSPKVMELTQRVYHYWAPILQDKFTHFDEASVILGHTSVGFDPSIWDYFVAILFGAKLVIAGEQTCKSSTHLISLMKQQKVTDIIIVPEIARALQLKDHLNELVASGLRALQFTGSCFDPKFLQDQLLSKTRLKFFNCWGPTEFGFGASIKEVTKSDIYNNKVAIGQAENDLGMQILIEEQEGYYRPVREGEEGRIYLKAPHSIKKYENNDIASTNNFPLLSINDQFQEVRTEHYFDTGDTGIIKEKRLYCLGREHLTEIKIFGVKIDLLDVEDKMREHQDVLDVALVIPHELIETPRIAAYIQFKEACSSTFEEYKAELKDFLSQRNVQEIAIPYYVLELNQLPLLSSGKINRKQLVERTLEYNLTQQNIIKQMNSIESFIVEFIKNCIGVHDRDISLEQKLEEVGCPSLYLMSLRKKIIDQYRVEVAVEDLNSRSISSLASHVLEKIVLSKENCESSSNHSKLLILLKDGNENLPPICLLSGITGSAYTEFAQLIKQIKTDSRIYLLADPSENKFMNDINELDSLKVIDLAAMYLAAIKTLGTVDRVHLIGWSFGGNIAWEMAASGKVLSLQILDTNAPVLNSLGLMMTDERVLKEIMGMLEAMAVRFSHVPSELTTSSQMLLCILNEKLNIKELLHQDIQQQIVLLFDQVFKNLDIQINKILIQILKIVKRNMLALYQYVPTVLDIKKKLKVLIKVYASTKTLEKNKKSVEELKMCIRNEPDLSLGWNNYINVPVGEKKLMIHQSIHSDKQTDHFSILKKEDIFQEVNEFLKWAMFEHVKESLPHPLIDNRVGIVLPQGLRAHVETLVLQIMQQHSHTSPHREAPPPVDSSKTAEESRLTAA